jgi:hypothetical protein
MASPPQRYYQNILVALVSFLDGQAYHKNTVFSQERLGAITADDMLRWMKLKAFGTTHPQPDANPTGCRSSSLQFWKKALSFYMPNKHHAWDSLLCRGNPTRSREILDLIKFVKKKEVCQQGVPSQVRRPFTLTEFRSVVHALKAGGGGSQGMIAKWGVPAQMCFQFHLIARINCVSQFLCSNLKVHDRFPQALKAKLNWSKNVLEERDAPWQMILRSIDLAFCVLLNLSLWLVLSARRLDLEEGEVGTHSIRKCASTHVRGNGVSKDDKDTRGRWKATGRVSDRYDSCLCNLHWRRMYVCVEQDCRSPKIRPPRSCSRDQREQSI